MMRKLMMRATGVSLNGRRMSLAVLAVILGFLQQRKQQRGGVPMGHTAPRSSRLPVNRPSWRLKISV